MGNSHSVCGGPASPQSRGRGRMVPYRPPHTYPYAHQPLQVPINRTLNVAHKLDLVSAIHIWTAWATASTNPNGPQLPLEFRAAALDTLIATLITPAALCAQTLVLAQWALHSIPIECPHAATYGELYNEEDMAAWYDPASHPPQSNPHHTNMLEAYIMLALYLILSNFRLHLYTLIHTN